MNSLTIAFNIENYPDYAVLKGGAIINKKTGRKLKKTLNGGYTKGVWFSKKFITEYKLKPLLKRPKNFKCPF